MNSAIQNKNCFSQKVFCKEGENSEMSYRCSGKRGVGLRCKLKVDVDGGFCKWHIDQEVKKLPCKCFLPSGSACLYPALKDDLCEYHQRSHSCQGRTILGDTCLKAISTGKYCWNCSNQQGVIMDSIKEKTDEFRGYLLKEGTPAVPTKKLVPVYMGDKITVPSSLKKVEIVKPDDCCICIEPMVKDFRSMGCGHYFHDLCLSALVKMECPMCRTVIPAYDVPKWVAERIACNIAQYSKEKQQEQTAATQELVQTIIRQQVLDMNSSEEEDFNNHLNSGAEMSIIHTTDVNGNGRIGIVFLSQ